MKKKSLRSSLTKRQRNQLFKIIFDQPLGLLLGTALGWCLHVAYRAPEERSATSVHPTSYQVKKQFYERGVPSMPGQSYLMYSPKGPCQGSLQSLFAGAREEIAVAMYAFTDPLIGDALIEAHNRGVRVRVLSCATTKHFRNNQIERLKAAGIAVRYVHGKGGLMHLKSALVDNKWVAQGSYNYTKRAQHKNIERLEIRHAPSLYVLEYRYSFCPLWEGAEAQ